MITTIDPTTAEDIALGPYSTDCTMSVMQPPRSSLLLVEQFELGRVPQGEGTEDLFTFAARPHFVPRGSRIHLRVRSGAPIPMSVSVGVSPRAIPSDPLG